MKKRLFNNTDTGVTAITPNIGLQNVIYKNRESSTDKHEKRNLKDCLNERNCHNKLKNGFKSPYFWNPTTNISFLFFSPFHFPFTEQCFSKRFQQEAQEFQGRQTLNVRRKKKKRYKRARILTVTIILL